MRKDRYKSCHWEYQLHSFLYTDIREDVVKTPESGQTQHVNKFNCVVANHPGMAGMARTVIIFW